MSEGLGEKASEFGSSESEESSQSGVRELLDKYSIPYKNWGIKEGSTTQSIEDLEKEVREGLVVLREEEGGLIREASIARLDVRYIDKRGKEWELFESKRILGDGREGKPHGHMGKIVKTGEEPTEAILRGIKELGIDVSSKDILLTDQVGEEYEPNRSWKYPGIKDRIHYYNYTGQITSKQVDMDDSGQPKGYVSDEEGSQKETHYEWRPIKKDK